VTCLEINVFCNSWDYGVKKMTLNLPFGDKYELYYRVVREKDIEKGEYSAVQAANKLYSALGGTNPRKTYNGFPIRLLK